MGERRRREPTTPLPFTDQAILRHVGAVVRRRREARGYTRQQLAAMIGRSDTMIARLEQGRHWLHITQLLHIAALLDIPLTVLFPHPPASTLEELSLLLQTSPPQVLQVVLELLRIYRVRGVGAAVAEPPTFPLHYGEYFA